MTTLIRSAAVAAVVAAATLTAAPAADCDRRLVHLAHEVLDGTKHLEHEFKKHFRHSGAYCHLMEDLSGIRKDAKHIDHLAHRICHESLVHVRNDIVALDRRVHHLTEVVEAAERGRYRGHIDGDTCHVKRHIASINRTLHAMECHVNDALRHRHYGHADRHGGDRYDHRDDRKRGEPSRHPRAIPHEDILREVARAFGLR